MERGSAGAAELHAGAAHPLWRRSSACEGSRRAVDRRQAPGDLCRPGRALRAGLAALRRLAERLAIPVTTSLGGSSSFPETHPLSLGSGGLAVPRAVPKFLEQADVIFGIGCSFTETSFGIAMPKGKTIIHSTLDPAHLNKDVEAKIGLVGDAGLVLDALLEEINASVKSDRDASAVAAEIAASHKEWLAKWMPKLTHNDAPLNPYRVLWICSTRSISKTPSSPMTPAARAISCRRSGRRSSRCPISAGARPPSSATGWGLRWAPNWPSPTSSASTSGAMRRSASPAWISRPRCASGIPIMSILLNNFSMAIELKVMPISTEKYRSTDISGDYAAMARAFGGHGERVTKPEDIIPAIKRGIAKTREGIPVLLEFITSKETEVSRPGTWRRQHQIVAKTLTVVEPLPQVQEPRDFTDRLPADAETLIGVANASVTFDCVSIFRERTTVEGRSSLITAPRRRMTLRLVAPLGRSPHRPSSKGCGGVSLAVDDRAGAGRHRAQYRRRCPRRHVIRRVGRRGARGSRIALACFSPTRSSRRPPAPRRSCPRTSRPMPGYFYAAAPHSRSGTPRNFYRLSAGLLLDGAQQGRCARWRGDASASVARRTAGERPTGRRRWRAFFTRSAWTTQMPPAVRRRTNTKLERRPHGEVDDAAERTPYSAISPRVTDRRAAAPPSDVAQRCARQQRHGRAEHVMNTVIMSAAGIEFTAPMLAEQCRASAINRITSTPPP